MSGAEWVVWGAVAALVVPYALFPLIVACLPLRSRPAPPLPSPAPPVAVVLCVHNAEAQLGARIENLLAQAYPGPLQLHIGLDGCSDGSAALVERYQAQGQPVTGHVFERRGKVGMLEALVPQLASQYPLLAFTDVGTHWASGTLAALVAALTDAQVAIATGVPAPAHEATATARLESSHLALEARSRTLEVWLTGVLIGAFGPCYLVRSASLPPTVRLSPLDDFSLALLAQTRGLGTVAPDASFHYTTGSHLASELRRKRRLGTGAGHLLRLHFWAVLRRSPVAALLLVLRRGLRWLTPFSVLVMGAALGVLVAQGAHVGYRWLLALWLGLVGLGVARYLDRRRRWPAWLGLPGYAVAMQGALQAGWVDFLRGRSGRIWQPSEREVPQAPPRQP